MPITTWTAKQVAEAAGIAPQSARDLVRSLGLACVGRDVDTGAKLYDCDQAQAALANRPGRGSRTDLGTRVRPFTAAEWREVESWTSTAAAVRTRAVTLGAGRAADLLHTTAAQLDRLVQAARRHPLHAMHPGWGDDHRRVYLLASELGRQLHHQVVRAHHEGHRHPLLWEESDALLVRLVELVDLAATGKPYSR